MDLGPLINHVDGDKFRLEYPYYWYMGGGELAHMITVPKGFEFDVTLPNIPLIRKVVNPHDLRWLEAALVHDYLLVNGVEKNVAASEFRRVLRHVGMGSVISWLAFIAVLWFTNKVK